MKTLMTFSGAIITAGLVDKGFYGFAAFVALLTLDIITD